MLELMQFEYMRNALIAAILVSIACGIVGTFVVIRRIVFISGGITHAAFGGIGLGFFLGIGMIIFIEMFNPSIRTEADVEKYLKLSTIATIPKIDSNYKRNILRKNHYSKKLYSGKLIDQFNHSSYILTPAGATHLPFSQPDDTSARSVSHLFYVLPSGGAQTVTKSPNFR